MKISTLVSKMVLSVAVTCAAAQAHAGNEGSHGGGGVIRNGIPMTFGTANILVEPKELSEDDLPELKALMSTVMSTQGFSTATRSSLMGSITPTDNRKYFAADRSHFDAATYARIVAEYARRSGQDPAAITIFAVTDTETKRTILLPTYFALQTPAEKMAILYHEGYWITHPKADYASVILAETHFQKWLETKQRGMAPATQAAAMIRVLRDIGTVADEMKFAISYDLAHETLRNLLKVDGNSQPYIPAQDFFGAAFYECIEVDSANCSSMLTDNFFVLATEYPDSLTFKVLRQKAQEVAPYSVAKRFASYGGRNDGLARKVTALADRDVAYDRVTSACLSQDCTSNAPMPWRDVRLTGRVAFYFNETESAMALTWDHSQPVESKAGKAGRYDRNTPPPPPPPAVYIVNSGLVRILP